MNRFFVILMSFVPLVLSTGAAGQSHDEHGSGQPTKPVQQNSTSHAGHGPGEQAKSAQPSDPHAAHVMPSTPSLADPLGADSAPVPPAADPHAGHVMPSTSPATEVGTGAQQTVGNAPPPPPITDYAADRVFGSDPMNRARELLAAEHGSTTISKVMINIAEYQAGPGGGGYRWDGRGWYGGDINRLVVKAEGEGNGNDGVEAAEVQALYSRAIARYTDAQIGIRHDFAPGPERTYVAVGLETLLPYWFEVEGAAFLSDKGDLIGRLEGSYDLQLTQRIVLQPQAELRWSAQDIPELGTGSGISHAELGLRLRYEIKREFAPYIGVAYERTFGRTSDFARARGENVESTRFVVGIRTWF
jgi:copper resistance protein B